MCFQWSDWIMQIIQYVPSTPVNRTSAVVAISSLPFSNCSATDCSCWIAERPSCTTTNKQRNNHRYIRLCVRLYYRDFYTTLETGARTTTINKQTHNVIQSSVFSLTSGMWTHLPSQHSLPLAKGFFNIGGLHSKIRLLLLKQFHSLLADLLCFFHQLHLALFQKLWFVSHKQIQWSLQISGEN